MAGHPPRGRPPNNPAARSPHRACRPRDSVGPPHPHTRAHSTWVADPNSPPSGRAVGGGTAPDLRRPSQWWKAPPPGTPFRHPHSEQRRPARAHAVGPVLGPHARRRPHPGHTGRRTPAARSRGQAAGRGTAPDTRRPSQQWQAFPPWGGPTPPPRHAAPTGHAGQEDSVGPPHQHTRAHSMWLAHPNSPPSGRAVRGGTAPHLRRPSQWWKAPPPGTPFRHPHSEQRRPVRAHAVGPVLCPHTNTDRTRDTRVAEPWLPAPEDGRPGEGQRLTPDAPHNGGRPLPPGTAPHHPRGTQPPQGMQAKGAVLGPHTHTPAPTACGWRTPTARPVGGQSGEGQRLTSDAPHNNGRHPPRVRLSATCTASNASPQGQTLWGRCWVPTPAPTTPGTHWSRNPGCPLQRTGGRGGGQRRTPDAPHNGGRSPPPGTAPHHPRGTQPPQGMQATGTVLGPHTHTPAPTARGWRTPTARPVGGQSPEGQRLTSDAPHNGRWHPPRGRPSANPTASNAGPQGRTLWGWCWVPTPAPTAPGTHGSRNPGCPLQRTGGQGRDSA